VKDLKLTGDERYSVFKFKKKDLTILKILLIFVKEIGRTVKMYLK
jgi:hypothetical protein